jgi:iron complex outermembrane receptor protein
MSVGVSLAMSAAIPAIAQTDSLNAADRAGTLEEVVVTATKRSASVQDIPLSVTAISGAQLTELQITSLLDLDKTVPGMTVNNKGNDPVIIMRGAGAAGVNDIAVPIYIDGLYRPRAGQALASYIDVERVEVLRGPQGTLFGRNTLGGLVNLIANKPDTQELSWGAAATLGDYDYQRVEGYVNIPMGDTLALRITASDTTQDPLVENTFNSSAGLKDEDNTYARAQLLWAPTDTFDITLTGTYWEDTANGNADYAYKVLGIPINPATGQTNGINGRLQPRQGVTEGFGGGKEFTGVFPNDSTAATLSDPFEISSDFRPQRDIEETSFSALINWDLGFADLRANLGMFDYEERRLTDSDISANPTLNAQLVGEYDEFCVDYSNPEGPWWYWDATTQQRCGIAAGERNESNAIQADINLNSNSDGNLQWTLGYFLYDDSDPDDTQGEFVYGYANSATPQSPRWAHWLSAGYGGTKSQAVYGQAEYAFTDRFRLTGGLRYSEDERNLYSGVVVPESRERDWPTFTLDRSTVNKGEDDHTDWRIAAQYDIGDNMMLYASAATGYIAGSPIRAGSTELSDPNEVEAFELGLKSTLLDGAMTLNVALFNNDYDGLSTTIFVPQGGTIIAETAPGGSMTARGLEVEMVWQATPSLNITAGANYDDSELDEFTEGESRFAEGGEISPAGDRVYDLSGTKPRFSPDYTLNLGISYDWDLGGAGMLIPGAFIFYTDDYKTQNVEYFFAKQDAYTTLDLRLTWMSQSGGFSAQAFVKNATDEEYLTETTVFSGARAFADYGDPRTYGLRVGYNF